MNLVHPGHFVRQADIDRHSRISNTSIRILQQHINWITQIPVRQTTACYEYVRKFNADMTSLLRY